MGGYNTVASYLSAGDIAKELIKDCLFLGRTQLGGALWFLRVLFVISVGHLIVCAFYKKFGHERLVMGIILVLTLAGAQFMDIYGNSLFRGVQPFFAAYLAYLMGIWLKKIKYEERIKLKPIFIALIAFIVLVILNQFGSVAVNDGEITNVVFYIIASLSGWFLLWAVSKLIGKIRISTWLAYVGQWTICIVLLHLLSFKIVSFIYLKVTGEDMLLLACYPVLNGVAHLWIAYTVIGVGVPLLADWIYLKCKNRIMGKVVKESMG